MAEKALARIRRFKLGDIDAVLDIEEHAFPKTAYSKEILLSYAARLPDSFVVVETRFGVAGYIIFDSSGHIYSTAVKPTHRRKGFGRMLFLHALKCAKQRLWLEVRSNNISAVEFYKKMGMRIE